jgi:hypothetical protein
MNGMLGLLPFAGAPHIDFERLRRRAFPGSNMAFMGTMIATAVVGLCLRRRSRDRVTYDVVEVAGIRSIDQSDRSSRGSQHLEEYTRAC